MALLLLTFSYILYILRQRNNLGTFVTSTARAAVTLSKFYYRLNPDTTFAGNIVRSVHKDLLFLLLESLPC